MINGIFGWSLPPGCGTLPGEEPFYCDVCGAIDEDQCICSECPVCGDLGNPDCYKNHGMKKTVQQEYLLDFREREFKSDLEHYWELEREET